MASRRDEFRRAARVHSVQNLLDLVEATESGERDRALGEGPTAPVSQPGNPRQVVLRLLEASHVVPRVAPHVVPLGVAWIIFDHRRMRLPRRR